MTAGAIWVCAANNDPVASRVARLLADGGVQVTAASDAARAVVVLSPELATTEYGDLAQWIASHGMDTLVVALGAGEARWDDDAGRFDDASSAVPESFRTAFDAQPIVAR